MESSFGAWRARLAKRRGRAGALSDAPGAVLMADAQGEAALGALRVDLGRNSPRLARR